MRYILEQIFLAIFTKIDPQVGVNEKNKRMTFNYEGKTYELTIKERS